MANFKYDVVTLIQLVESKPCLWDKTNENNKNKMLRDRSWQEIFQYLDDSYKQQTQAAKKKTGDTIISKWANIRDSFMRSLRTKSGQPAKKSDLYSDHLQFLLKLEQKDDTESNFSQVKQEANEDEDYPQSPPLPASNSQSAISNSSALARLVASTSKDHRPSKRALDATELVIPTELKKTRQSIEPHTKIPSYHSAQNDHEMLLLSFLPYIRDMSEIELMDLQMDILTTIKNIKQKRVSSQSMFLPSFTDQLHSHVDSFKQPKEESSELK